VEPSRLAAIPLFQALQSEDLDALAAVASGVDVAEGQTLAAEGDFGHALYGIESGTAEVTRDGEAIRTLGPGDVFGEVAVLASGRRTATVIATSPMTLIAVFKRDVWRLEQHSPEAAARLRELVEERLAGQTS
jgi:CPA1 family monovalent cation:H+ antiporter